MIEFPLTVGLAGTALLLPPPRRWIPQWLARIGNFVQATPICVSAFPLQRAAPSPSPSPSPTELYPKVPLKARSITPAPSKDMTSAFLHVIGAEAPFAGGAVGHLPQSFRSLNEFGEMVHPLLRAEITL